MGNQTSNGADSSRSEGRGPPGHQHAHTQSHGHPGVGGAYQNVANTHIIHPGGQGQGQSQGQGQGQGQSQNHPHRQGHGHSRHPPNSQGGGSGGGSGHHHHPGQEPSAYNNRNPYPNARGVGPPGSEGTGGGGGGRASLNLNRGTHPNQHNNNMMVQRSSSDTAMSVNDDKAAADGRNKGSSTAASVVTVGEGINIVDLSYADDDVVPTVFRWEHGGREVYITGTFNEWTRQIPMHRSGNDFTYIHNLNRGKHAFKFIVDDEWRFAPDQPTVADIDGRINNFIDVTDFKPYTGDKSFEQEKNAAYYAKSHHQPPRDGASSKDGAGAVGSASAANAMNDDDPMNNDHSNQSMDDPDGEVFTHNMPDMDEYTKDPPPLPPHLRHIILNKPPQLQDTAALPIPQHVALNHLYCTAIRDNMMVLGITQRFKTKFVTTVHYSPELSRT